MGISSYKRAANEATKTLRDMRTEAIPEAVLLMQDTRTTMSEARTTMRSLTTAVDNYDQETRPRVEDNLESADYLLGLLGLVALMVLGGGGLLWRRRRRHKGAITPPPG